LKAKPKDQTSNCKGFSFPKKTQTTIMTDLNIEKLTLNSTPVNDNSRSDAATLPHDVERFFALLSTEPMMLAYKDAVARLDEYFVSAPYRQFMVKIIENGLKTLSMFSPVYTQLDLARAYLSKPGYIKKSSRETIKLALNDIMDKCHGMHLDRNIEWTQKECLYAFTCLGVSDLIANVFRKIHVHTWSVSSTPKGCILASGDLEQGEFEVEFRKSWNHEDFSADLVLAIIVFERSSKPLLIPDCSQGSSTKCFGDAFGDGTVGGFLHVKDEVFALTAAHCVPGTPSPNTIRILSESIDVAGVKIGASSHESFLCSLKDDILEKYDGIPDHNVFELGTPVYKFGKATGLTVGYLHELQKTVSYEEVIKLDNGKNGKAEARMEGHD
jgi:hypothetical protein